MRNKALAAPYLVWMAIFTVVPLGIVIWFSFTDSITGAFTFANISRMGTYLPIFLKSIWLAILSSLICLVIGYPVAYCLASAAPERQRFLYMLVMLPMCMSFLLRTLAWVALLDDTGIINGVSPTEFEPEENLTRAHLITMVYRMAGEPTVEATTTKFTDVKESSYYYKATLWAEQEGIVNGTTETTFEPDAFVLRIGFRPQHQIISGGKHHGAPRSGGQSPPF